MAILYVATSGTDAAGNGTLASPYATPGYAAGASSPGDLIYIKSDTYTLTTTTPNTAGGPVSVGGVDRTTNTRIEGYQTNPGDKGTPPFFNCGSLTGFSFFNASDRSTIFDNLSVDGGTSASVRGFNNSGGNHHFQCLRCKAANCSNGGFYDGIDTSRYRWCEAIGCGGFGFLMSGSRAFDCVAHGTTGTGFISNPAASWTRCISYSNSGSGFDDTSSNYGASESSNCIAYNNGGSGWLIGFNSSCENCIAYGNTSVGFNASSSQNGSTLRNCAGGGNSSNYNSSNLVNVESFIILSTNPFNNGSSGDFSLVSGSVCRAAGYPGIFPNGTSTGYLDIGAVQSAGSGGGGTIIKRRSKLNILGG